MRVAESISIGNFLLFWKPSCVLEKLLLKKKQDFLKALMAKNDPSTKANFKKKIIKLKLKNPWFKWLLNKTRGKMNSGINARLRRIITFDWIIFRDTIAIMEWIRICNIRYLDIQKNLKDLQHPSAGNSELHDEGRTTRIQD